MKSKVLCLIVFLAFFINSAYADDIRTSALRLYRYYKNEIKPREELFDEFVGHAERAHQAISGLQYLIVAKDPRLHSGQPVDRILNISFNNTLFTKKLAATKELLKGLDLNPYKLSIESRIPSNYEKLDYLRLYQVSEPLMDDIRSTQIIQEQIDDLENVLARITGDLKLLKRLSQSMGESLMYIFNMDRSKLPQNVSSFLLDYVGPTWHTFAIQYPDEIVEIQDVISRKSQELKLVKEKNKVQITGYALRTRVVLFEQRNRVDKIKKDLDATKETLDRRQEKLNVEKESLQVLVKKKAANEESIRNLGQLNRDLQANIQRAKATNVRINEKIQEINSDRYFDQFLSQKWCPNGNSYKDCEHDGKKEDFLKKKANEIAENRRNYERNSRNIQKWKAAIGDNVGRISNLEKENWEITPTIQEKTEAVTLSQEKLNADIDEFIKSFWYYFGHSLFDKTESNLIEINKFIVL
jgi:hypothetical protein